MEKHINSCPKCLGTQIIRDTEVGEEVCSQCGLVISNAVVDAGAEWRAYDFKEMARSRAGQALTPSLWDQGMSTNFNCLRDGVGKPLKMDAIEKMHRLSKYDNRSKVNDTQAGYETGMSCVAGVLSGVDMLNMAGLLDALKAFDFAKAVIDDEIALMLKRLKRGLEFSEENLALEVISKVGPGGNFMMEDATMKWMKTASLLTKIADRNAREVWQKKGALDTHARGLLRARQILSRPNLAVWSTELDNQIKAEFPGLVSGDAILPEGW